jgi:hypothetical protein
VRSASFEKNSPGFMSFILNVMSKASSFCSAAFHMDPVPAAPGFLPAKDIFYQFYMSTATK